jgi:hypothetical protein
MRVGTMIPIAMTTFRIRIKTGNFEFEAEGPADDVSAQIVTFLRLLGSEDLTGLKASAAPSNPPQARMEEDLNLSGKMVSLTPEADLSPRMSCSYCWVRSSFAATPRSRE